MKHFYLLKTVTLVTFLSMFFVAANAQKNYFSQVSSSKMRADSSITKHIKKLAFYQLKETELRNYLLNAPLEFKNKGAALPLEIPLPDGTLEIFEMLESPVLSPSIAAKHPEIKTYTGKGKIDQNHTIRISFTSLGFNAIILGLDNDAAYYDKISTDKTNHLYRVYFAKDAIKPKPVKSSGLNNKCGSSDRNIKQLPTNTNKSGRNAAAARNSGTILRTFKLAMAADGKFTQRPAYGGDVNAAYAGLVGYVNRLKAIYRTELSVDFLLVSDESIVYPNPATDPYTDNDQEKNADENQVLLDQIIKSPNYDIGHLLGSEGGSGGGLASSLSVCNDLTKGQGVSGVGDGSYAAVFDDQLIAHEVGHQFNMSHSYHSSIPVCTTREPSTSVEPGSGITILSYGFTCSDATDNDDYETPAYQPLLNFHTVNYDQAQAYINTLFCYTSTLTNNAVPVITLLPSNKTIPKSTPFVLAGNANDANAGNVLSYSWEGTNIGTSVPDVNTLNNTTQPPFFRTYAPAPTGTRYFPRLSAILDGTNTARGDKLPSIGIATTHRMTVRDNVGGVIYGDVTVTIDGNSGPFLETTNLSSSYQGNSMQTITWSVANTTAAPVSCPNVNILLSTDGGLTFPTTLIANTPNDGSETIALPLVLTTTARIKVECSNNIFFDISNKNFAITAPVNTCQLQPFTIQ